MGISNSPYAFVPPGVPFTYSDLQKFNSNVISTAGIDLKDYNDNHECIGVETYIDTRLYDGHGTTVRHSFYNDTTGKKLFSYTLSVPNPSSSNYEWWNWYKIRSWIGKCSWEINRPMTVRIEVEILGNTVSSTETFYIDVQDTTEIDPETANYRLDVTLPTEVVTWINSGAIRDALYHKIHNPVSVFGWDITKLTVIDSTKIGIYFHKEGSVSVAVVIGIIIAALVAIITLVFGYVKHQWALVRIEDNKTVQQGYTSKDSALNLLKQIRDSYVEQGLDTTEIDNAIIRLSETEPEAPGENGDSSTSVDWTMIGILVIAALAVSNR